MSVPTLVRPAERSDAIPGWSIAADLTPPSVLSERRLALLRSRLVLAIALAALAVATGYAYAFVQVQVAENDGSSVRAQTVELQHEAATYAAVTTLRGSVTQVRSELASLMGGDVDGAVLIAGITNARPSGVAIGQLTMTLTGAAGAATSPSASGLGEIGSITIVGNGNSITDVSDFIDALQKVPGIANVVPSSNAAQSTGTQFNLTLSVTSTVLSGRFAAKAVGTK